MLILKNKKNWYKVHALILGIKKYVYNIFSSLEMFLKFWIKFNFLGEKGGK